MSIKTFFNRLLGRTLEDTSKQAMLVFSDTLEAVQITNHKMARQDLLLTGINSQSKMANQIQQDIAKELAKQTVLIESMFKKLMLSAPPKARQPVSTTQPDLSVLKFPEPEQYSVTNTPPGTTTIMPAPESENPIRRKGVTRQPIEMPAGICHPNSVCRRTGIEGGMLLDVLVKIGAMHPKGTLAHPIPGPNHYPCLVRIRRTQQGGVNRWDVLPTADHSLQWSSGEEKWAFVVEAIKNAADEHGVARTVLFKKKEAGE